MPLFVLLAIIIGSRIMWELFKRKKKRKTTASWSNPTYIYVLKDGRKPFYVGRTNDLERRLKAHIRDSYKRKTKVQRYIGDMLYKGRTPKIITLKITRSETMAKKLERHYIKRYGKTNTLLK